jgi:hypothetical protein
MERTLLILSLLISVDRIPFKDFKFRKVTYLAQMCVGH